MSKFRSIKTCSRCGGGDPDCYVCGLDKDADLPEEEDTHLDDSVVDSIEQEDEE